MTDKELYPEGFFWLTITVNMPDDTEYEMSLPVPVAWDELEVEAAAYIATATPLDTKPSSIILVLVPVADVSDA